MKSMQEGIAVLTKKERERREEKAKCRALEVAKAEVQALADALAAERADSPDLAAADAEAARAVNPRVRNGGKN